MSRRFLFFTVFIGGMTTLAIEFTTSRMLQTVYGTSNLVWANVIGLVLLFLTAGYFIGGRLADRYPNERVFYGLITTAGFCSIFFLLLTSFLLKSAASALAALDVGAIASSLIGVVFALTVPITLLGCISPFAIRLGVDDISKSGQVSGQIYAISTLGSIAGTYIPVLFVIPLAGSRLSAIIFGTILLSIGLIGLWRVNQKAGMAATAISAVLIPFVFLWGTGPIKDDPDQLFETESTYNYIQVIRRDDCNYLLLNEGQAFHSFYCDNGRVSTISVWSIMLAAPYFNDPADVYTADGIPNVQRVGVIGLAAGTIPKQFVQVYSPFTDITVDGIELDPDIVQAGYDYFELEDPRINVIVGDGRYEFNRLDGPYDVITIDAYKVPYIPWHLTTADFFGEIHAKLSPNGVVAINVGRVPEDRRLIEALTATMGQHFPSIHTVDVPGSLNTVLYATKQPTTADNLTTNLAQLPPEYGPLLAQALLVADSYVVPTVAGETIFTDERAPVETIVDSLVINYILSAGVESLPTINNNN